MAGYMKDLGNGKFQFEVSKGRDGKGKRNKAYRTITLTGSTPEAILKKAEKQLALFVAEVEKDEFLRPTHFTFSEYTEEWKKSAQRNLAPKTFHRYNELLQLHILPKIGQYKLEVITPIILENAYEEMRLPQKQIRMKKDGTKTERQYVLSEMTLKHIHRLIGTILQTAFRKGLIRENPISRTDAPKAKKHEVQAYDTSTITQLLSFLEDTDIQFKAAVHITLAGGLRLGELMGLEWEDIDYENCLITIRQAAQYIPGKGTFTKSPKNETSVRTISMPTPVMNIINELEHQHKVRKVELGPQWKGGRIRDKKTSNEPERQNRLFLQADGNPMHPYTPTKQWKKFIEEKGLPSLTFHGLRHTSASYLISLGQDVASVSKRLGHSNINTTLSIYTHAFKKKDEEAANRMALLYANNEESNANTN